MSTFDYNRENSTRAQMLRKNMTPEEKKLWYQFLNKLPVRFRRQKAIGNYIVDFYCTQQSVVIELDGSQHYENAGIESDKKRDEYLQSLGLTVLRYSNLEINKHFDSVCNDILNKLDIKLDD